MARGARPKRQPSPAEIARFGHIAALLRRELDKRKWSLPDLSGAIGLERENTSPYAWLGSRAAPARQYRAKLAKLFGVKESEFMARDLKELAAGALVPVPQSTALTRAPTRIGPDVLGFNVDATGNARLRLDVTLPLAVAAPLLRMLLDAGIVMGERADE